MALVNYSDSESDTETPVIAPTIKSKSAVAAKSAFSTSQPGKIRVDLPSIKPTSSAGPEQPPAKRARTGGTFSGFNSLLPAPKRAVQNAAPKRGVSLKTSSEAAFSRAPASAPFDDDEYGGAAGDDAEDTISPPIEVKLTGKNTMFIPNSVANKQKSSGKVATKAAAAPKQAPVLKQDTKADMQSAVTPEIAAKPKQSLFSFQAEKEDTMPAAASAGQYEPLMISAESSRLPEENSGEAVQTSTTAPSAQLVNNSSLSAVAADMNLTPAQRRQLFGRNAKNHDNISVANFNIDSEYASNEALRQSGDVFQHRAVKSIAPGKHSLQQLVNNARSQQGAIEDAWAEGRRNRGEGGSKYGWTNG